MRLYIICVLILVCDTIISQKVLLDSIYFNRIKYSEDDSLIGRAYLELAKILQLVIADNGIGLEDQDLESKQDSFGHKLVHAFKLKLNADVIISSKQGTKIRIDIKEFKIHK